MNFDILQIGNPALKNKAKDLPVNEIPSKETQELIQGLIKKMRSANGAGLAATQIGVPLRIFVVEVNDNPRYPYKPNIPLTVVINPKITFLTEDLYDGYEGCLSVPNLRGVVNRCPKIRLEAYDENGALIDKEISGIAAGTFQHEFDHLDGLLFTDKLINNGSLCTIEEFKAHYEKNFIQLVQTVEDQYCK